MNDLQRGTFARRFVVGSIGGVLAWILGFLVTFAVVIYRFEGTRLAEVIDIIDGRPAHYEIVGWVFFNAHGARTLIRDLPLIGTTTRTFINGNGGFPAYVYLAPVAALILLGALIGYYLADPDVLAGALVGLTMIPGYLFLSIAGLFLFEMQMAGATVAPDPIPTLVLGGIVWPTVFGGIGGALGVIMLNRDRE